MNINLANLTAAWERGDVGELCTLVTMKAPSLNESCAKCQHVLHSYEGRQGAPVVLTSCQLGRDACLLEGAALLGSITKWDELGVQPMWQHHVSNGKCCTYVALIYNLLRTTYSPLLAVPFPTVSRLFKAIARQQADICAPLFR